MAEASTEIPLIPDTIEPESSGIIEPESSGVQRNVTERTNSRSSGMKIPSRYLRASTGSCHDYCKYGKKHEVEAKARVPIRKFITARRGEGQDLEMAASADRKIKLSISCKPSPDSETRKEVSKKGTPSSKEDLSALEGIDVSVDEDPNIPKLKPEQSKPSSLSGHGSSINERDYEAKKSKASLESPKGRRRSKNRSKEMRTSLLGERKALNPPTVPSSHKHSVRRGPSRTIARKSQNKTKDAEPDNVPEKILYVIESTLENITLEPTQDAIHTPHMSPSSTSTTRSTPSSQKNSRSSRSGIHASQSPTSPSSYGNKGLRSTRSEITKPPLSSLQSSTSPSEYLDSKENGVTSLHQTKVTEKKRVNLQAERRIGARRAGKLVSENKNSPAHKLKFRRGTILDLKPENNTPRRLKFRRVKMLGEIENGKEDITRASTKSNEVTESEVGTKTKQERVVLRNQNVEGKGTTIKRSLRRKESGEGELIGSKTNSEKIFLRHQNVEGTTRRRIFRRKETNGSELSGTKTNSEKVVLRHQNVAGKKEVQSLFNNVIEETASKLVESRKSKVKALVGAFETVISLQDTKPSATAGAS